MKQQSINQPCARAHSFLTGLSDKPFSSGAIYINPMEKYFNIYVHPKFKDVNYLFEGEEFRDISGFEGMYQVSNFGRIKSLSRLRWSGRSFAKVPPCIPCHALGKGKLAYYSVHLWKENKRYKFNVHRLVAIYFLGGILDQTVNHKDGVKINNFVSNLEWASYSANNLHAHRTGLIHPNKGVKAHNAKLNDAKVVEIRNLLKSGVSPNRAAEIIGINPYVYTKTFGLRRNLWSVEVLRKSLGSLCDLDVSHKKGVDVRCELEIEIIVLSEEAHVKQ